MEPPPGWNNIRGITVAVCPLCHCEWVLFYMWVFFYSSLVLLYNNFAVYGFSEHPRNNMLVISHRSVRRWWSSLLSLVCSIIAAGCRFGNSRVCGRIAAASVWCACRLRAGLRRTIADVASDGRCVDSGSANWLADALLVACSPLHHSAPPTLTHNSSSNKNPLWRSLCAYGIP